MPHPFNCSPSARNHRIDIMLKLGLCLLTMSAIAFGQVPPAVEKMNKDAVSLQNAVNDLINVAIPGWGLPNAKGAYLEGMGFWSTSKHRSSRRGNRSAISGLQQTFERRRISGTTKLYKSLVIFSS